jgi:TRAP-type C4-dicarboxylate transport system substrate-binding protein
MNAQSGGAAILTPAAEIYAALEWGVIDACQLAMDRARSFA